ncbi:uncharacterized protein PRCAT00003824001 [Priceomyces carsonii]|uniref:uncharacterized protein n=1 Tax=Priceomyces carsonii TaxID=28549 RepID=UPI002EDA969D|nr:unnamed protein product [Priceomyces carsonii]
MTEFEKIEIKDRHVFHGNEFPVAFKLKDPSLSTEGVLLLLEKKASEGFFNELLDKHGAVLLRNLGGSDPSTLSKYINAIGTYSGHRNFVQNGSTAKRTEINEILSTANEGPPDRIIYQHNEFSRFVKYPRWLFFVCEKFTGEDGETPIVHGGELFEDLFKQNPEGVKDLARHGVYFEQIWPRVTDNNTSWSDRFCFGRYLNNNDDIEEQKKKAEIVVKDSVSPKFEWDNDNNLIVHQHSAPIRVFNPTTGDKSFPVFFNSIAAYYADNKYKITGSKKTADLKHNNGERISGKLLDQILDSSIKLQYNHKWETGDVVIIDNYQVSHGRLPWKNGDRKVLVSMWDFPEKPEYEVWKP